MNARQRRTLRRKWERYWLLDWPWREDATVAERDRWARQDEAALGPRGWVGRLARAPSDVKQDGLPW